MIREAGQPFAHNIDRGSEMSENYQSPPYLAFLRFGGDTLINGIRW
jgi:hypothetical protein